MLEILDPARSFTRHGEALVADPAAWRRLQARPFDRAARGHALAALDHAHDRDALIAAVAGAGVRPG